MTPLEKFTPGPWTDAGHYTVMAVNDPHTICEVYGTSDEGFREGHANVTLIAAAPDMYAALDQAPEMDAWPDMTRQELEQSLDGYVRWFNETAMPALRKARGEK